MGERVVFNIAGNKYRLVVWINYPFCWPDESALRPRPLRHGFEMEEGFESFR
ncbi:MAG: type II toxin-antitoxin system HigB family toxin [Rhodospirillales bacterium]